MKVAISCYCSRLSRSSRPVVGFPRPVCPWRFSREPQLQSLLGRLDEIRGETLSQLQAKLQLFSLLITRSRHERTLTTASTVHNQGCPSQYMSPASTAFSDTIRVLQCLWVTDDNSRARLLLFHGSHSSGPANRSFGGPFAFSSTLRLGIQSYDLQKPLSSGKCWQMGSFVSDRSLLRAQPPDKELTPRIQ